MTGKSSNCYAATLSLSCEKRPAGKTEKIQKKKNGSFERVAYFSRKAGGYMELICSSRLVQNRPSVEIELRVKSLITSSSSYRGAQARLISPLPRSISSFVFATNTAAGRPMKRRKLPSRASRLLLDFLENRLEQRVSCLFALVYNNKHYTACDSDGPKDGDGSDGSNRKIFLFAVGGSVRDI